VSSRGGGHDREDGRGRDYGCDHGHEDGRGCDRGHVDDHGDGDEDGCVFLPHGYVRGRVPKVDEL